MGAFDLCRVYLDFTMVIFCGYVSTWGILSTLTSAAQCWVRYIFVLGRSSIVGNSIVGMYFGWCCRNSGFPCLTPQRKRNRIQFYDYVCSMRPKIGNRLCD